MYTRARDNNDNDNVQTFNQSLIVLQAAIGSIALDLVRQNGATNQESLGMTVSYCMCMCVCVCVRGPQSFLLSLIIYSLTGQVLTVAVLAIVLCAPLGAILSSVLGPWLLEHPVSSPGS